MPTMPWTDEHVVVDHAGSERTTAVRAYVIHHGKPTFDAGNTVLFAATTEFLDGAFRGHLAQWAETKLHEETVARRRDAHIC